MPTIDDIAAAYTQQDLGAYLDVLSPIDGEPIGLRILVRGYEGEHMKTFQKARANEVMKRRAKPTAETVETQTTNTVIETIMSWEWAPGVTIAGERPEATPEGIRKVFKILPFVSPQVDVFAGTLANFFDAYEAQKVAA